MENVDYGAIIAIVGVLVLGLAVVALIFANRK